MTDTQPTLPLPPDGVLPPRRRRRRWPWIVAAVVVLVLLVVAAFLADGIARGLITRAVQQQVRTQFSLPADQNVDVQIDGAVLPQLVSGTIGRVEVAAPMSRPTG